MKRICILSAGTLPVPPVKGGAVENLIDIILRKNEDTKNAKYTVASVYDKTAAHKSSEYAQTEFYFVKEPLPVVLLDRIVYFLAGIVFRQKANSFRCIFQRLFYINSTRKMLLENDFDCVIAENHISLFLVMKDRRMKRKYGEKFIYHAHNEAQSGTFGCRRQIENCPLILTVSDFISKSWKAMFPNGRAEYKCVMNGIDISLFSQELSEEERLALQKKLSINQGDFVIIFAGRLVEGKGILQLARVFARLPVPNKKLLIVGAAFFGSMAKSPIQKKLEEILEPCKNDVRFTGYIPYSEMWKYYKISSVAGFVPVWNEPCALTNIEAQASSLPVVTTMSGGIPEYSNPESRILLPIDGRLEESVYEKIMWLYENPGLQSEYGKKNAEYAKIFSIENFYKSFITAIGVSDA